jgi:nucleoside-diphosphate-sugar epimerase
MSRPAKGDSTTAAEAPKAVSPDFEPTMNPDGEMMWRSSPSRYIAKIHVETGKELLRPIDPEDLLVHAHRDNNPIEVAAQYIASRAIQWTGNEKAVQRGLRKVNLAGMKMAESLGLATGSETVEARARKLLGVGERDYVYRFRELTRLSEADLRERIEKRQKEAAALLRARGRNPKLVVLLTGATGFLGKEILVQAALDRRIARVISVVRPERIRDPKTREVIRVLSPAQRGAVLLRRLGLTGKTTEKFAFIGGDIEEPSLGIAPREVARLQKSVTHVVHCAASVSFDDTYENSYRANVLGARNALEFAFALQNAKGSRFIQHLAIETSYIHGRKKKSIAQESALTFPKNFYNNYYELTKAMASIETDRFLVEKGLRVSQLLPSIVIGHSRTGNNRGDTKVVNAPINAFGRAKEIIDRMKTDSVGRAKAWAVMSFALAFPSDRSAELNIVPVDRVVAGILAALSSPQSIGERVHLATDNRIRAEDIIRLSKEEIGIDVRLADPTLFRNVTLPVVKAALERMKQPKLANALSKLGTIFGGYGEWGQPIHDVGNDVRVLGLPLRRPSTEFAFRMLCRHNRFVQEFGQIRDDDEVARRELLWEKAIDQVELQTGQQIASIRPDEFKRLISQVIDLKTFRPR